MINPVTFTRINANSYALPKDRVGSDFLGDSSAGRSPHILTHESACLAPLTVTTASSILGWISRSRASGLPIPLSIL